MMLAEKLTPQQISLRSARRKVFVNDCQLSRSDLPRARARRSTCPHADRNSSHPKNNASQPTRPNHFLPPADGRTVNSGLPVLAIRQPPETSKSIQYPWGAASAANASGFVQTRQSKVPRPRPSAQNSGFARPGNFDWIIAFVGE
jgi:hypothetical protein